MRKLYPLSLVLLIPLACSFFEPRIPEYPEEPSYQWYDPYFPSAVLANLKSTFEAHNITYMQCFDSTYVFQADPQDTLEYGGSLGFSNWDYAVEYNVMDTVFGIAISAGGSYPEDSLVSMELIVMPDYPDDTAPSDSTIMYREYEIVVAGSEYCGWDSPAMGYAKIHLIESDYGLWSIRVWEDYRLESPGDTLLTWGVAKANYR